MVDIIVVIGLIKGVIYGNFENKEVIVIVVFDKSVNDFLKWIGKY